MTAGLALFFWLLARHRRSRMAWMQLLSVGLFSCLAFLVWNGHANRCYAAAEFSYGDLGFRRDSQIWAWMFGDLASRFHFFDWARGAWRASTILLGSLGLVALPLVGFWLSGSAFVRLWIAAGLCCVAVFTHVVLVHWHYYFIFSGAIALLCARAVVEFEPMVWERLRLSTWMRVGGVLLVAGLCIAQGLQAVHLKIYLDRYLDECGRQIREHSAPADKLIVWGGEWTGPLLRAERQGVCTSDMTLLTDPEKLRRLKELGYTKVVLMNPSPLLVAVTTASRSGLYYTRDLPKEVPTVAKDWRVVFSSPALLILEIPR
jgi:hypothetical protein